MSRVEPEVTVRKSGEEVAEYEAVWPKSRKAGELMEVGSITVTPEAYAFISRRFKAFFFCRFKARKAHAKLAKRAFHAYFS